jgi:hypothetical protein
MKRFATGQLIFAILLAAVILGVTIYRVAKAF